MKKKKLALFTKEALAQPSNTFPEGTNFRNKKVKQI